MKIHHNTSEAKRSSSRNKQDKFKFLPKSNVITKMDSKMPTIEYEKVTCKECEREFLTIQALRSHEIAKHKASPISDTKESTPKQNKKLTESKKAVTIETKKVIPETIAASRVSKRLQLKKGKKVEMTENTRKSKPPVKSQNEAKTPSIKTEFECPLCDKVFTVFFSASQHIQKKHKLDKNESTLETLEMEPIRIERCTSCSDIITDDAHVCDNVKKSPLVYKCLGCQKKFTKLFLFNNHVITSHSADADFMVFRGVHDFSTWKVNMESQVKVKYSIFDKASKEQYHQCNYVSPKNQKNITFLCPSVIITKQLSNKFEIQYYKRHYGHSTPDYQLLGEYKKNLTDKNDADSTITDVYQKFKTLMQSIIDDASKTNLDNLKQLLSMAIKMQSSLDNKEADLSLTSKSMTDNQITDELEGKKSVRIKRKAASPDTSITKRSKVNQNANTLLSPSSTSPPSFNDSYKQFIDSTISDAIIPPSKKVVKKELVKTKIGQFSPKKTSPKIEVQKKKPNILRPRKNNSATEISEPVNIKDIKYEVREQENDCNILVLKI